MIDRRRAAAWLAVSSLFLLAHLPLLDLPLERDEGAFAAIGEEILHGAVPYRDVFDHKPAGVHYAYAAALLVVPPTTRGIHAFLLGWTFATMLVVAAATVLLAGEAAAVWAAALFAVLSASPAVQGFSASSEMLLLLPLSASIWLALRAARRAGSARLLWAALAGGMAAAACWFKPPAALPALGGALALASRRGSGGWRDAWRSVGAWLAAGALVGAMPWLLLSAAGAEPWYWLVEHNRLYAALAPTDWSQRVWLRWQEARWDLAPCALLAAIGLAWSLWRRRAGSGVLLAWLTLSLAAVPHTPFLYRHYLALALPALAAAGGLTIAAIRMDRAPLRRLAQLAVLALVLLPGVVAEPWYWRGPDPRAVDEHLFGAQGFGAAAVVADYLRAHSAPNEAIFVFGSEPQIPFLARRRDPNPYKLVYPLTWNWPRAHEFQQRAWSAVAAASPAYLVIARAPPSLMLSPQRDRFFEEQLSAYAEGYQREQLLVYGRDGYALVRPPAPAETTVLYELWARRLPRGVNAPQTP